MRRLALAALLALPLPVQAMEIAPGTPGLCQATLTGQIGTGDAAKLAAFDFGDPPTDAGWEDGRWKALCLDSPGGQLAEALIMAQDLLDRSIGTVVRADAACLSACALLFMFGTAYQHESNSITHRRLHVQGRLGFHQPDLLLDPTRSYSVEDVRAAYNIAIEATLRLLALAARPRPDGLRPFIDSDLQEEMLAHKGADYFEIDTVNKAGRWDVALFGFAPPKLSESALLHACQNMTAWPAARLDYQVDYTSKGSDVFFERANWPESTLQSPRVDIIFPGMMIHECSTGMAEHWTGAVLPMICGFNEILNAQVGPEDCRDPDRIWRWRVIPDWAFLPANTPLRTLR